MSNTHKKNYFYVIATSMQLLSTAVSNDKLGTEASDRSLAYIALRNIRPDGAPRLFVTILNFHEPAVAFFHFVHDR